MQSSLVQISSQQLVEESNSAEESSSDNSTDMVVIQSKKSKNLKWTRILTLQSRIQNDIGIFDIDTDQELMENT